MKGQSHHQRLSISIGIPYAMHSDLSNDINLSLCLFIYIHLTHISAIHSARHISRLFAKANTMDQRQAKQKLDYSQQITITAVVHCC